MSSATKWALLIGTTLAACGQEAPSVGSRQAMLVCAPLMEHACGIAQQEAVHVTAAPSRILPVPPPVLNQENTHYVLDMPTTGTEGVVLFRPTRAGRWSLAFSPAVNVSVLPASGASVIVTGPGDPTACDSLVRQIDIPLDLQSTSGYRLAFTRPAGVTEVHVVAEFLPAYNSTHFRDEDGDGHGNPDLTTVSCMAPPGYVDLDDDCEDQDATVAPGLADTCDGRDNDCDPEIDENPEFPFWADADGDGYGVPGAPVMACAAPEGYVTNAADCDDGRAEVSPGGTEVCNTVDDNCDGVVDEGVTSVFYGDGDADGFGAGAEVVACAAPAGHVAVSGDCDDVRNDVYPGAAELCDLADNDCDAVIDEDVGATFYRDGDADGYGATADAVVGCTLPEGYALAPDDCDDQNPAVSPGAAEVCDEIDNDCDGFVDEDGAFLFYRDVDADGHGDGLAVTQGCRAPEGFVAAGDDCNDARADVAPGAAELCDGIDNDCDLAVDEDNQVGWFRDADGDGFGDAGVTQTTCRTDAGWVTNADDCDDTAGAVNPGAEEICDGADNDCDGNIDGDTCQQCDATTLVSEMRFRPIRLRSETKWPSAPLSIPSVLGVLAGNARYGFAYLFYQTEEGSLGLCAYRGNQAGNAFVLDTGCGCDVDQVIDARWVTLVVATLPWYGTTRASATLLPPGCE